MTIKTDAVIIGAGPVGLFQVFELGLLGLKAELIDSLAQVGGQCSELYPEKPIYDIPAWPVIGAQELIDKLREQIRPFEPGVHLNQEVTGFEAKDDGRFRVETSKGKAFDAGAVIIAAGLGAFQPRRLRAKGLDDLSASNIHYKVTDRSQFAGKRLLILGGGDSALDWTLDLADLAEHITLVHRRHDYRAQPASVAKMKELVEAGKVTAQQGTVGEALGVPGRIDALELNTLEREKVRVEGDEVLVFWGLAPNLGPIADWSLQIEKKQIPVDTEKFQTSIPGVFAIGDINTYPGKKKLILSGFHEAALAAFGVQKHLDPEARQFLQYTTTSPIMHKRLGVAEEKSG
ncbi:NAD(P)/FAD-dependent oxidoreductase [Wenzhouxiangella sp. XN79A]|uniref:NAD(P)/FAD-dependent oxidoreductase n=1 Tax=Wenzhouxiangella sp. XN79A TaxID=2724193 RepID=UPI00144AEA90|nr:NAD(P)/FAD-dependent oxidoreductase [Wenzhouxiangella sp. XN79A]NKI35958.1 NAD(P)/FAD-dependent oxidoreductase [Wenzhouxiangella sp. XN79A]